MQILNQVAPWQTFKKMIDAILSDELKQGTKLIEETMNKAMNDKAVKAAAQKQFGAWPPIPNSKVEAFHHANAYAAWTKIKRSFEDYKMTYKLIAPKNKEPRVAVTLILETRTVGGLSYPVKKGETLASIAKNVYGSEEIAEAIIDANPHLHDMPSDLRVPAGFAVRCPQIKIPKRHAAFGIPVPRLAKEAAKDVPHPGFYWDVSKVASKVTALPFGPFLIMLSLTVKYEGKIEVKGTIDAKTDYKREKVSVSKELAGLTLNYDVSLKGNGNNLSIDIVNTKWRDIEFKTSIEPKMGTVKLTMTPAKISKRIGQLVIEGEASMTADLNIKPNPNFKPPPAVGPEAASAWKTAQKKADDALDWIHEHRTGLSIGTVTIGVICLGAMALGPPPAKAAGAAGVLVLATGS